MKISSALQLEIFSDFCLVRYKNVHREFLSNHCLISNNIIYLIFVFKYVLKTYLVIKQLLLKVIGGGKARE